MRKWLLCLSLLLVWHIEYFTGKGGPGNSAFIKAIEFANKNHAKQVQIVPAFYRVDMQDACFLIWAEEIGPLERIKK
jgi:hypothetical protein